MVQSGGEDENVHPDDNQLIVTQMNHVPQLEFGPIGLGETQLKPLHIVNSSKESTAHIDVLKFTKQNGFSTQATTLSISPGQSSTIGIRFTPLAEKCVRTTLQLILNGRFRLQCVVFGQVRSPARGGQTRQPLKLILPAAQSHEQQRYRRSLLDSTALPMKKKKLAQQQPERSSKLTRRIVYDEKWMEKQQQGFETWINYTIAPSDDKLVGTSDKHDDDSATENHSLRILALKQQDALIRRQAAELYHSTDMDGVVYSIEREVCERRLCVRKDREIHADLGLQRLLVELVLSYHPMWLRLGLETILNVTIPIPFGHTDRIRRILKHVVVDRMIKDPGTLVKYSSKSKKKMVHRAFEAQYTEELNHLLLQRFLMLVYFLDQARKHDILPSVSCLFACDSKIKSSQDVLGDFCKHFLSGEGNIVRHLNLLGYQVQHVQRPLDEYQMTVSNLATDLRDGVRLVRLVETLTHDATRLSRLLRVPAVSRLQKIHNVDLALKHIATRGIAVKATAKEIVDGHRERTLTLLWTLLSHFKVSDLVDTYQLRLEIDAVVKGMTSRALELFERQGPEQEIVLEWCRAVASCYGLEVRNFTTSFADGRVICYLLHYYHPELLSRHDIHSSNAPVLVQQCVRSLGCIPLLSTCLSMSLNDTFKRESEHPCIRAFTHSVCFTTNFSSRHGGGAGRENDDRVPRVLAVTVV